MGVEPGEFSVSAMKLLDRERLMKVIYAFSGRSKKIRKDKRRKRKKEEDNIKKNIYKLSAKQKTLETHHPDEEHKPRLPDSIAQAIINMPLSRMEYTTFAMPSIIDSHDMGLRTVFSPDTQKKTPIQRLFKFIYLNVSENFVPKMAQFNIVGIGPTDFP
ncbi:hypothetical protein TNCV_1133331 [Trichonephila clavipes]|nr:hypothetical protein TNCV_1133331 [Trichonephila clavipes]